MTDDDVIALYERSVDDVYRYASRLTGGDRAWTDELVQDTYLHLMRRARDDASLDVDVGWLIVSCRHRFLDEVKRRRRSRERERRLVGEPERGDAAGRATEALDELPVDQRMVLVLRYIDGFSVPEVARSIGRSVHATESLLARARTALRRILVEEPS